jgi:hypothetical protein
MKKALVVLCMMVAISASANPPAQAGEEEIKNPFFLDYQRSVSRGFEEFRADWCYTNYSRRFPGFFSCVNARHGYGEAYLGPMASFGLLDVGAGMGFEAQDGENIRGRYAIFVRREYGRLYFHGLMESEGGSLYRRRGIRWKDGEGEARYRAEIDFRVAAIKLPTPTPMDISLGALYENGDGVGPRLKVRIPNVYTKVWAASLYHVERREMNYVVGAHVIFY